MALDLLYIHIIILRFPHNSSSLVVDVLKSRIKSNFGWRVTNNIYIFPLFSYLIKLDRNNKETIRIWQKHMDFCQEL